jgi:two-component system, OmpR family, sensor kinase
LHRSRAVLIPVPVRGGAFSGWRPEVIPGTAEVERVLTAVAERSLTDGARAGLDALLNEALRLTGGAGLALHEGRERVAEAGLLLPPLSRLRAAQVIPAGDGRTSLAVVPERAAVEQREVLVRIAQLAGKLLAARRRERSLQERQASLSREVQRQRRELAYREGNRSRASHDLRTPVLVIQGYLDMMSKGLTGELTPSMKRYVERMQSATQDMALLISRQLARGGTPEDLRSLLLEAFEPLTRSGKFTLNLECAAKSVPVRGNGCLVQQLARLLARDLSTSRARVVHLRIDAQEPMGMWRLCVSTDRPRLLQSRQMDRLDQLLHRLGGALSIQDEPPFELRLHLPAATFTPAAR